MARGDFKHQRLLDVRGLQLQLKAVALKDSQDRHRDHRQDLEELRTVKQTHLRTADITVLSAGMPLMARDFQVQAWHTQRLNTDLMLQINVVQTSRDEVEQLRQVAEVSAMEKQTLEKLKERHQEVARRKLELEERKMADEVAARRHLKSEFQEGK